MAHFSIAPNRRRAAASISAVLFAVGIVACGGAEKPASSPSAAPASEGPQSDQAPEATPSAPSTAGAAPSSTSGTGPDREAALRGARDDLRSAMRELDASIGDCSNACRALSSLSHATAHLCEMADSSADRSTCEDAKSRVARARAQIKASCGACSNGESLDVNAPIR